VIRSSSSGLRTNITAHPPQDDSELNPMDILSVVLNFGKTAFLKVVSDLCGSSRARVNTRAGDR
jgi:hypothetical protein